ncbi:MAG: radical SAM protein [Thermoanaerobaculaceae bacterium]|nr:radical SAM protein [Thermoanaerobaculaceae bacterium]
MFSDEIERFYPIVDALDTSEPLPRPQFAGLLAKACREDLDAEEIARLLNATRDEDNRTLVLERAASLRRPHDREVLLLPPLYFSSICENRCAYCEFSTGGGKQLDLEEFEREFSYLLSLGFRSIELVSSQDPQLYRRAGEYRPESQVFDVAELLPFFDIAHRLLEGSGGGMLTTNIPPLDVASLRLLKNRGLDCFLVWQETFDPRQYRKLHYAHGPKGNQAFRLNSMENAIAAGIEHLAGAFLKGLHDWRREEVFLYLFDRYLRKRNGRGFSIIGTPRVKGRFARSSRIRPYRVSDQDYVLNIALDRILFDGVLWLQTRESFAFNLDLIQRFGGGVILTLVSSTAPGGYAAPSTTHAQFPVHKQDLEASMAALRSAGIDVHLDWDSSTLGTFLGRGE